MCEHELLDWGKQKERGLADALQDSKQDRVSVEDVVLQVFAYPVLPGKRHIAIMTVDAKAIIPASSLKAFRAPVSASLLKLY